MIDQDLKYTILVIMALFALPVLAAVGSKAIIHISHMINWTNTIIFTTGLITGLSLNNKLK